MDNLENDEELIQCKTALEMIAIEIDALKDENNKLKDSLKAIDLDTKALVDEIDALREALELICDTASTEWQESDGTRKGAVNNRGERLYFVSKELIEDARIVLAKEKS